jgi:hypothetical protein
MKTHRNLTLNQANQLFDQSRPNQTYVVEWKLNGKTLNVSGKAGKVKAGRYIELIERLQKKGQMFSAGVPDRDAWNRLIFEQNDGRTYDPVRRTAQGPGFVSAFPNGTESKVRVTAYEYSSFEREEAAEDYRDLKKAYPFTCRVEQLETTATTGTVLTTKTEPAVYDTDIGRLEVIHSKRKVA